MKRLQLRHHNQIFESRDAAVEFFRILTKPNADSISETQMAENFGTALYAEPIVLEYTDGEGKTQVILAIGNSAEDGYHFIDTGLLSEEISGAIAATIRNSESIEALRQIATANAGDISDLTSSVSELSGSVVTEISNISSTISDGLSEFSGNVETKIESVKEELSSAVSAISETVTNNYSDVTSKIETISSITNSIREEVESSASDASSALNIAKRELTDLIGATSAETLGQAKDYVDDVAEGINATKVVDIVYTAPRKVLNEGLLSAPQEGRNGYVQLRLADGTLTEGFDASDFLMDSVITNVWYDEANGTLNFVWNDRNSTQMSIPLTALSNIYSVSEDSVTYLKMNGSEISALVDEANGFVKTLATTEYAKAKADEAVEKAVERSAAAISANTKAIEILNGAKDVDGSVRHIIDDKFAKDVLTAGTPATAVSLEEARAHSLIRKINVNGEDKYYVSSDASDMQFVTSGGARVNLNQYITSLEDKVSALEGEMAALNDKNTELEDRIVELENNGLKPEEVREIVKSFLIGTEREIKVTESGEKIKIGFADDAIFGDYLTAMPE